MPTNLHSQYLEAIRQRVCAVCLERTAENTCGMPDGAVCPIEPYVDKIVRTVHDVSSDKMADYVAALRKNVCALCPNSQGDGNCPFRQGIQCSLDRYFALVVDAIEDVDEVAAWSIC